MLCPQPGWWEPTVSFTDNRWEKALAHVRGVSAANFKSAPFLEVHFSSIIHWENHRRHQTVLLLKHHYTFTKTKNEAGIFLYHKPWHLCSPGHPRLATPCKPPSESHAFHSMVCLGGLVPPQPPLNTAFLKAFCTDLLSQQAMHQCAQRSRGPSRSLLGAQAAETGKALSVGRKRPVLLWILVSYQAHWKLPVFSSSAGPASRGHTCNQISRASWISKDIEAKCLRHEKRSLSKTTLEIRNKALLVLPATVIPTTKFKGPNPQEV